MKGPGPFSVFAPTDEAFAKILTAQLDALLKDNANVIKSDVAADNGVIHVIDTVVMPK